MTEPARDHPTDPTPVHETMMGLDLRMQGDSDDHLVLTERVLGAQPYALITMRHPREGDSLPGQPEPQVVMQVETGGGAPPDVEALAETLEAIVTLLRATPDTTPEP